MSRFAIVGVRVAVVEFECLVERIAQNAHDGKTLEVEDYYPEQKRPGGTTRELPLAD
jgi:hypothetical protein